jgi:hypothetical protein
MLLLEHAGLARGGQRVIGNGIPCAEYEVIEVGERHELFDAWRALVSTLAESNGRHLRERPDWLGKAASNALDAGDERSSDRAEARRKDAEAAGRGPRSRTVAGGRGTLHERDLLSDDETTGWRHFVSSPLT